MQLLGFLITAAFWPGMAGAATASRWTVLLVAVPIALFGVRVSPFPVHWIGAGLLFWATLSLVWTPVLFDGVGELVQWYLLAGLFLVGASCTSLTALYRGMGLGLGISAVIAVLQASGYDPVVKVDYYAPPSGLFVNPDLMGEISVLVLIGLLMAREWAIAVLVLPALVLSQSRTAMLAGAICCIVYFWRRCSWRVFLPAFALLCFSVLAISPNKWLLQPTGGGRIDLWLDTIQGIIAAPLSGHGIGSLYSTFIAYATHIDTFSHQPSHAHNDILELAFELGIPAALLAVAFAVMLWWRADESSRLVLLALGVIVCFAFPLHDTATAAMGALVAGFASRAWADLRYPVVSRGRYLYAGSQ